MSRYPFADNDQPILEDLKGILSISICCGPDGFEEGAYNLHPAYAWIRRLQGVGATATITIRLAINGNFKDVTAIVAREDGLQRVPITGTMSTGWLTLRGSDIPEGDFHYTELQGELEPATITWVNFGVSKVSFKNEARIADPELRVEPQFPNMTEVESVDVINNSLEFKNGYNCSLSYNPNTGELVINGVPGEGEGLPEEAEWDSGYGTEVDTRKGLITVNGIFPVEGDIPLEFGEGINVDREEGVLTLSPV